MKKIIQSKEKNKPEIVWVALALVIGVLIGLLFTGLTSTGQAKSAISANQLRDAQVSINNILRLHQNFDNLSGFYNKKYYYLQWEYVAANYPATVYKDSQFSTSDLYTAGSYDELELKSLNGHYFAQGYSYSFIPFNQNNLTVYSAINGEFIFGNGQHIYKHQEAVANQNGSEFAEVSNFDLDCSGYIMEHLGVNNITNVQFYLNIYDPNGSDSWQFNWDATPQRNNSVYSGNFPLEATNILANDVDYFVDLVTNITVNYQNMTSASTYKRINCQTRKQSALSPEQLNILKEKSGNTPKAIAEKLIKEIGVYKNK